MTWLFLLFICASFGVSKPLYGDAYLAEDRIYYGADSYTVDYDKEIVYAQGNAFFRKGEQTVRARKITIYYAKDKKEAFFFDNVIARNSVDNTQISGDYGEARFKEDVYIVTGNAEFKDVNKSITADKIEARGEKNYYFYDNVHYRDKEFDIKAPLLSFENQKAHFRPKVEAILVQSGDTVYCNSIEYFEESGNIICQDEVLYIQKENEKDQERLVIGSDIMRYFSRDDLYILIGNAKIMNGLYTMSASLVNYFRKDATLEARGDVVVYRNGRYIYCDDLIFNVENNNTIMYNSVKGIFMSTEIDQESNR